MLTPTDKLRIIAQLNKFECTEREAKIYLHCLTAGPSPVQKVARDLKQNRVTVHSAIEQMIKKGLLAESRRGKKRLIIAEDPEALFRIVQRRKNELRVLESNLDYVVKLLHSVQPVDASTPSVKFYEGVDGFKKMLEETLTARDGVRVFTYVKLFSELIGADYLEDYFQRRSDKGIHTKLIFPPCAFAERVNKKAEQYKIQIRLLPGDFEWKSGFFSWNDCVSLKSFTQNRITCTIIENKDIAYFIRNVIFELVWGIAKPITELD